MDEKEVEAVEQQFAADIYARRNLVIESGKGALLWDKMGKEYIDCMGAYGVAVVGHCHPKVVEAIKRQSELLIACHNSIYTEARSEFLKRLMAITPQGLKRAFLCNSGAESVEAAIKIARRFTGKTDIVAFVGAYHGKTTGALSGTWNPRYRAPFQPLLSGFTHVPYGKIDAVAGAITDKTAAVIVEPIQGESGIRVPPMGFLKELRELCDKMNVLLIFDEVQTGFGRTGKNFACEHSGVIPDIICLAKAVGGGLPLGVTIAREEVMAAMKRGEHSSTFGGNPLVCAAGSAAIDILVGENLAERASTLGKYLVGRLEETHNRYNIVREVRGMGLMIGVECRFDIYNILMGAQNKGVIVLDAGRNILRFLPPLVITKEQLDRAATIVDEVVGEENVKTQRPST
ncbi:aspartate aminotransferase family protein [Candidatus Bathyarchaeota archaeon]|nr:aspartate aminotransferase family protein [Candidatus Bathyarchaeota archaeon]